MPMQQPELQGVHFVKTVWTRPQSGIQGLKDYVEPYPRGEGPATFDRRNEGGWCPPNGREGFLRVNAPALSEMPKLRLGDWLRRMLPAESGQQAVQLGLRQGHTGHIKGPIHSTQGQLGLLNGQRQWSAGKPGHGNAALQTATYEGASLPEMGR